MRRFVRVLSAGILSAGAWGTLTAAPSAASGLSGAGTGNPVPVIVFLSYQPPVTVGQRAQVTGAAQAPYLGLLQQLHATDIKTYTLVNAFAATVPAAAATMLATTPGIAQVIPDSPIDGPAAATDGGPATATSATTSPVLPGACPASGTGLEPEGLGLTLTESLTKGTVTARSLGYTGAGVTVGFLADGLDPSNVNLMRRGKSVVVDYRDFSGDGIAAPTAGGEAFGDANAIAGQGSHVYDTRGFSAQSPRTACDIRIEGTAPGASVVALKVFNRDDVASTSGFLQAIDYAVTKRRVNVLDESFGASPFSDVTSLEAVQRFNDAANAAGVTVVVAGAGAGSADTIGSPAADPDVLSVGASTGLRFYAQTDYAAADRFATTGWLNDNISSLGSGGYTPSGTTVDMVAPGDLSFASCTAKPRRYTDCVNFLGKASPIEVSGGTSESAATVAAAAALVIQSYRKAHGGSTPAPSQVRDILLSTARDLGAPATEQGAGLLNSATAVELAAWTPNSHPVGESLRLSAVQLNAVASPRTTRRWSVRITNTGARSQLVKLYGRTVGAPRVVGTGNVTLTDAKSPHFTNWSGAQSNYGELHFQVPRGADLLNASITWPASAADLASRLDRVRLILIDARGRFAAQSSPQGVAGYGGVQVLQPAAGRWTAVVFSETASAHGTTGSVHFGASVSDYTGFGSVTPSRMTLARGQSGNVTVSAMVPAAGGDSSGALVIDGGYGSTSVPVTLRGVVDAVVPGAGVFSGVLTGGDGRGRGQGQVAAYQFTVPRIGHWVASSLAANVVLADGPLTQLTGYLVAPDGQPMGYASNYLTTGFTRTGVPVETPERQLTVYSDTPAAGTWTLIVEFTQAVADDQRADHFTGKIQFDIPRQRRGGLPDSAGTVLARGKAVSFRVGIVNTGAAPEDVYLDPRLVSTSTYTLEPQDRVTGVPVPPTAGSPPEWIVPTMTQRVHATAASKMPVMFHFGPFSAAPEEPSTASTAGTVATGTYPLGTLPTPVTPGLWFAAPALRGPASPDPTANMRMSVTTETFDTTVTQTAGDFWRFAVQPLAAKASYDLFVIKPGQTGTFVVTIKPTAARGTVVRGLLYVDDFAETPTFLSGNTIAALAYSYRVG
jgi:Subtilase family